MNKVRSTPLLFKLKAIALTLVIGCILHSGSALAQPVLIPDSTVVEHDFANSFSNYNRYLSSSSAIGVPKGQLFYHNNLVLLNSLTYGATDVFSVQAGVLPFIVTRSMAVFVKPELRMPLKNSLVNFSMGFNVVALLGDPVPLTSNKSLGGFIFGKTTIGTSEYNVSVGLGYPMNLQEVDNQDILINFSYPRMNIMTHLKIHEQFSLISENYIFYENKKFDKDSLFSITALRYHTTSGSMLFGPKGAAVDFGFMLDSSRLSSFDPTLYIGFSLLF